jgi:hypothetical protein
MESSETTEDWNHSELAVAPANREFVVAEKEASVSDLYLARLFMDLNEYIALSAALCNCEALCVCGWDDIGGADA